MSSWMIVSDSSCELRQLPQGLGEVPFATVPMKIRVSDREFADNAALDIPAMLKEMKLSSKPATTSCPSPEEWAEKFLMADNVVAICISSNLSGSYNSAMIAKEMVLENHPEKNIYVMDTLSTGGEMALAILKAARLIDSGLPFEQVVRELEVYCAPRQILFALSSFDNLVKNGRLNRVVGFIAGKMGMRIVGRGSDEGRLELLHNTRGETRTLAFILEEMDRRGYTGSQVVISHCQNPTAATMLRGGIEKKWPGAYVMILPCSGITSFYAQEGGLLVCY